MKLKTMRKKVMAVVAMVGTMALMATGCGAVDIDGSGSAGSAADSGVIGISVSTLNNPFFVTLVEGAKEVAEAQDVDLVVVDAGDDAAKQANDIDDLISRNVSVLIVNPVDSDAVAPSVETAISKGIKVISVDRVVNGVEVDVEIASDNVAGAEMATAYLVELVGKDAVVAELQGVAGASATIDRGAGFHNVADTELDVAASQVANFNREEGLTVMENMLQANSNIVGVFAHNDEMALGAVEAASAAGKTITIIGFDATNDALSAVSAGTMAATVAQQPDLMGATAVEAAIGLMAGEEVSSSIAVEVTLVTE